MSGIEEIWEGRGIRMVNYACVESMTKYKFGRSDQVFFTVRVWRECKPNELHSSNQTVASFCLDWWEKHHSGNWFEILANNPRTFVDEMVTALTGINAVEVLDSNGNGGVLYTNW